VSITGSVERITPTQAAAYREKMVKNRTLMDAHAQGLAAAMSAGEWRVNGQPIIFDEHGVMLDGQHRCRAIEIYGKAVDMLVVRGVKSLAFPTIDSGAKRTVGNVLGICGYAESNLLAASMQWAVRWERGIVSSTLSGNRRLTGPAAIALAARWTDMPDSVAEVRKGGSKSLFGRAHFAFLHWATTRANKSKAATFWPNLINGSDLAQGSAAWRLYRRVVDDAASRERVPAKVMLFMGIIAWNAHCEGRQLSFLRWRDDEPVPAIHGFSKPGEPIR